MLIAALPTQTGAKPGNFAANGDSLTQPFPSDVGAWWSTLAIPIKGAVNVRATFGGTAITTANSAANINAVNAFYDPAAPWNIAVCWWGTNDIVAGATGAAVYSALGTLLAALDPGFDVFFATLTPRSMAAGPLAQRIILNNLLINTPLGAGTIDYSAFPGTAGQAPYYSDLVHLTRLGQAWCGNACSQQLNAYLATL